MSEDQLLAEIEASLNCIPFDPCVSSDRQRDPTLLTGTCQFTVTGLGSWLVTFAEGAHSAVRCEGPCDPPPDPTLTMSPETYLRVLRHEGDWNAEIALHQGFIEMSGDWELALAVVGESF